MFINFALKKKQFSGIMISKDKIPCKTVFDIKTHQNRFSRWLNVSTQS